MSDIAIRVEHLSKQYRIGERESYKALRDVIADGVASPFRRMRSVLDRRLKTGDGRNSSNGHRSSVAGQPSSDTNGHRSSVVGQPSADGSDSSLETRNSKLETPNSIWALDDVSFEVKRGEVVGIIGRNGAGKSTLLKILSRITKPTKGHAKIFGRVGSLLEVGTGFHPELTGRENIYLNGAILGMRKAEIERKFDEIIAFAEVEKFIDTPVKRYSSGMYVRLAFAVAAHMETEVLLVDEVLAVGDAEFQKKCLGKMGDVAKQGRTVLFVSHNMGAVRNLCSETIWISNGTLYACGPSVRIVDTYLKSTIAPSESLRNLSLANRNGHDPRRLRITSIQLNDGMPIHHGEPLKVRIEFETTTAVSDVGFGFGFSSIEGIRVMTVDSDLRDSKKDLPENHRGIAEAFIPELYLQPDRYLLDVGARCGDSSALDYLPACAQLDILPGPTTPALIIRQSGGVRIPAQWEWGSDVSSLPADN